VISVTKNLAYPETAKKKGSGRSVCRSQRRGGRGEIQHRGREEYCYAREEGNQNLGEDGGETKDSSRKGRGGKT